MTRFRPKVFEDFEDGDPKVQENRVAREVGGKRQPGSGSSVYAKGDVDANDFLIECKQTKNKSIRIESKWLAKISREAFAVGKDPALSIDIKGQEDEFCERDWVAIPMSVFKRLLIKDEGGRDE